MPNRTVIEKVVLGPGRIGPSPGFLLHAGEQATVRLNITDKAWDATTGEGEPAILVDILIERSDDGGESYSYDGVAQMVGGGRTKDGQLPAMTLRNTYGEDRIYRVTATLNSRLSFGINWEQT